MSIDEHSPTVHQPPPGGPPPDRGVASQLGRYPVVGHLGAGGMGEVLLVRDEVLGREVAAKVCLGRVSGAQREKFVQEARICGQLEHPNIIAVHELVSGTDGRDFFTMKRVDGQDLEDLLTMMALDPEQRLSRVARLQIFLKVCDAMAFAHSRGVIHRDLKPGNIMVGQFGEVQVMDWGLAKQLEQTDAVAGSLTLAPRPDTPAGPFASVKTMDGTVIGTPAYMPPEQARGEISSLGKRSDVYALGAILYHMMTLVEPFPGADPWEVVDKVIAGQIVPPREHDPSLPWELEAVILKAMALDGEARYPTVDALRRELTRFLEGQTLVAARYSPWQRLAKWVKRHRIASLAALLCVVLVGGGGWVGWRTWRDDVTFRGAAARARRAAAEGRWEEALASCNRALAVRPDGGLVGLAARCRREIRLLKERHQEVLDRAARHRRILEVIGRLTRHIGETRPFFYVAWVDMESRLQEVRRSLEGLNRLAGDPANHGFFDLWLHLGMGFDFLGQRHLAEKVLLRAARLRPADPRVAQHLSQIYLWRLVMSVLSTPAQNLSAFQREQELALRRRAIEYLRIWFHSKDSQQQLDRMQSTAYYCFLLDETDKLLRLCAKAIKQLKGRPGVEELWLLLGITLPSREQRLQAIEKALALRPHFAMAFFLRGTLRTDVSEKLADYTRAVELDPYLEVAHFNRGTVLSTAGRHEQAVQAFDRAIALRPQYLGAWLNRGLAQERLGRDRDALRDYEVAIKLAPQVAAPYYNRGNLFGKRKQYERALTDYEVALKLDPDYVEAHINRGVALKALGRHEEALASYNRGLRRDPKKAKGYANRGQLYFEQKQYERAATDFEKAADLEPRYWKAWANLGRARERQGRFAEALRALRTAREVAPAAIKPRIDRLIRRVERRR